MTSSYWVRQSKRGWAECRNTYGLEPNEQMWVSSLGTPIPQRHTLSSGSTAWPMKKELPHRACQDKTGVFRIMDWLTLMTNLSPIWLQKQHASLKSYDRMMNWNGQINMSNSDKSYWPLHLFCHFMPTQQRQHQPKDGVAQYYLRLRTSTMSRWPNLRCRPT